MLNFLFKTVLRIFGLTSLVLAIQIIIHAELGHTEVSSLGMALCLGASGLALGFSNENFE